MTPRKRGHNPPFFKGQKETPGMPSCLWGNHKLTQVLWVRNFRLRDPSHSDLRGFLFSFHGSCCLGWGDVHDWSLV